MSVNFANKNIVKRKERQALSNNPRKESTCVADGILPLYNTSMENRFFKKFIELAHDPGIPYISKGNGNQLSK